MRPRHFKPLRATRLDRGQNLRRLLDAKQPALRAVRVQRRNRYARSRDAPTLQLSLGKTDDADDAVFLDQAYGVGQRHVR